MAPRPRCASSSTTRCSATSSKPTSPCPTATASTGITPAPRRASSTPSVAARLGLASGPLDNAPEEVLLDGNVMAEGHPFFAIGAVDMSDDGRWLAYTVDYTGFRQYTLYIKDLETGETLPGRWSAWAPWSGPPTISTSSTPSKTRSRSASSSSGGTCAARRTPATCSSTRTTTSASTWRAGRTRDGQFLVMESASHTTTECWFLPAGDPDGQVHRHRSARGRTRVLASIIAAASGSSAPTTAAATSAWLPRP